MQTRLSASQCRRRAVRIPLPLELQLSTEDGLVKAILRDVSLDEEAPDGSMGLGLFHKDHLPLQKHMHCLRLSATRLLFRQFSVTLYWTRQFGEDGYISGGRLERLPEPSAEHQQCPVFA